MFLFQILEQETLTVLLDGLFEDQSNEVNLALRCEIKLPYHASRRRNGQVYCATVMFREVFELEEGQDVMSVLPAEKKVKVNDKMEITSFVN